MSLLGWCQVLWVALWLQQVSSFGPAQPAAWTSTSSRSPTFLQMAASEAKTVEDPLLLRAARGEVVERTPVWMMRQAGRHMKVYRDLCQKHPTFRERSENADVATEIRYRQITSLSLRACVSS